MEKFKVKILDDLDKMYDHLAPDGNLYVVIGHLALKHLINDPSEENRKVWLVPIGFTHLSEDMEIEKITKEVVESFPESEGSLTNFYVFMSGDDFESYVGGGFADEVEDIDDDDGLIKVTVPKTFKELYDRIKEGDQPDYFVLNNIGYMDAKREMAGVSGYLSFIPNGEGSWETMAISYEQVMHNIESCYLDVDIIEGSPCYIFSSKEDFISYIESDLDDDKLKIIYPDKYDVLLDQHTSIEGGEQEVVLGNVVSNEPVPELYHDNEHRIVGKTTINNVDSFTIGGVAYNSSLSINPDQQLKLKLYRHTNPEDPLSSVNITPYGYVLGMIRSSGIDKDPSYLGCYSIEWNIEFPKKRNLVILRLHGKHYVYEINEEMKITLSFSIDDAWVPIVKSFE